MKQLPVALLVASVALVFAPTSYADVPVPINPQYVKAVRSGQGSPPSSATDEQLVVSGQKMCGFITEKGGGFTRSQLRWHLVQFPSLDGPIFDSAITFLCPDAWALVPTN